MTRKLGDIKITVTEDIARESKTASNSKCAVAGAIRSALHSLSNLDVGVDNTGLELIPWATWNITNLDGEVTNHTADIEPRTRAVALITLNDTDRRKMLRNWPGDVQFTLTNHQSRPKQTSGGRGKSQDDPVRRRVRDFIRKNQGMSDGEVAKTIGCDVAKVADTRKRMIPGPARPRSPRRTGKPDRMHTGPERF